MLSEEQVKARAAQMSEAVGQRVRVVYQPACSGVDDEGYQWASPPSWAAACRVVIGPGRPEFAMSVDEEDEDSEEAWTSAAMALRQAIAWEQAIERGEDPEAATASG